MLLFLAASAATALLYVLPTVTYVWTPVGDNHAGRRAILDTVVFAAVAVAGVAALGTLVSCDARGSACVDVCDGGLSSPPHH